MPQIVTQRGNGGTDAGGRLFVVDARNRRSGGDIGRQEDRKGRKGQEGEIAGNHDYDDWFSIAAGLS